jgi:hypothetical protein
MEVNDKYEFLDNYSDVVSLVYPFADYTGKL